MELAPFDRQDTRRLIHKLLDDVPPEVSAELYRYSQGYPFYLTALARRLRRLVAGGATVDPDQVRYAFLLETLWRGGQIYNYCRCHHKCG